MIDIHTGREYTAALVDSYQTTPSTLNQACPVNNQINISTPSRGGDCRCTTTTRNYIRIFCRT